MGRAEPSVHGVLLQPHLGHCLYMKQVNDGETKLLWNMTTTSFSWIRQPEKLKQPPTPLTTPTK